MDRKFNTDLARLCGIKAAVVADYIRDADFVNDVEKEIKFINDRLWVRCPRRIIKAGVACMSRDAIANAIWRLVAMDVIKVARLGDSKFDNTYWYSITEFGNRILTDESFAENYIKGMNADDGIEGQILYS